MGTFLSEYIGEIVVLILSLVLFVATEKWFPSTDATQKHFWAAILFIFSVVLGLSVKGGFENNKNIKVLTQSIDNHEKQTEKEASIHEIAYLYEQVVGGSASETLRNWGIESQKALEEDLRKGYIPISREHAPTAIAGVYDDAKKSIIASNVGSIDYYFDVPAYVQQNKLARDNHVPVVRFFIYSKAAHRGVKLTKRCTEQGLRPDNIDDFTKCVNQLTPELGSLCSVIVDFDATYMRIPEAKDMLIMDNGFVAETDLYSESWLPRQARATETPKEVEVAREYFRRLWGITGNSCAGGRMDNKDILRYFPRFKSLTPKTGEHLADAAFGELLGDAVGHPR
jgi:hypothetical protein